MAIGSTARKVLWARSADLCAYPGCLQRLTANLHDEESQSLEAAGIPLGEEAHIISGSPEGPRYDASYPVEKVDSYENLILLCPTHHRLVDKKDGSGFSVETLRQMKSEHEVSRSSLKSGPEKRLEEIELRTLAMVEVWTRKANLADWESLTWKLNVPVVRLPQSDIDLLAEQAEWAMMRHWPIQYPELRRAFNNYTAVLRDTVNHIRRSMKPIEGREEMWEMYREYKHRIMSQPEYDASLHDFEYRTDLLCELSWELTKAANFVCDSVRLELDPLFRFDEGVLPHRVGDGIFVNNFTREEYGRLELDRPEPYVGLGALEERVKTQGGASR
ncbi:HNH endonuclease signature motif containing protein [Streptomyces sp. NPDC057403]|uniref:HNH endonuclease signature motif containing protein n=1 Tax=Streptomyces sp. NPDC057403 TaxID=3346119 RepID=UPI0036D203C1